MDEIIEYKVVTSEFASTAAKEVNELIIKGFQPFGGLSTSPHGHGVWFNQAMVKYVKPS